MLSLEITQGETKYITYTEWNFSIPRLHNHKRLAKVKKNKKTVSSKILNMNYKDIYN